MALRSSSGEKEIQAYVHDFEVTFWVEYDVSWIEEPQASVWESVSLRITDSNDRDITKKLKESYPSTYRQIKEDLLERIIMEDEE